MLFLMASPSSVHGQQIKSTFCILLDSTLSRGPWFKDQVLYKDYPLLLVDTFFIFQKECKDFANGRKIYVARDEGEYHLDKANRVYVYRVQTSDLGLKIGFHFRANNMTVDYLYSIKERSVKIISVEHGYF